jgi:hypothetical protein
MNHEIQKAVFQFAGERGLPEPVTPIIKRVLVGLINRHRLSLICHEIDDCIDAMCDIRGRIDKAVEEGDLIGLLVEKDNLEREKGLLKQYERLLEREGPLPKRENGITDEMIQRAREYPFEDLLPEPLKRGRCKCPVHEGKNSQSFSVKDNKGKCHSCGWYGDTIKFVMDTQGLTFVEAVRKLS